MVCELRNHVVRYAAMTPTVVDVAIASVAVAVVVQEPPNFNFACSLLLLRNLMIYVTITGYIPNTGVS